MEPTVDRAIKIFSHISDQLGPKYLAYWVLPNIVLTLSGARAYCDSVFWDDDQKGLLEAWSSEIEKSLAVVKKQIEIEWSLVGVQEPRPNEKYAGMELITKGGLQYVLSKTELFKGLNVRNIKFADYKDFDVLKPFMQNLESQTRFKDYPKDDFGNIAFGILLGYPDKAVAVFSPNPKEDIFEENRIDADIRGAGYYVCPQPVYDYPRHLMNDPTIAAHEKLWSTLLEDYYKSSFHKNLEKNKDFQTKMRELGNLR